ncbi:MAG TPA: hypothetical protein VN947_06330 [Polyangia bacterium]|nr:hypothetical protein [Polyangia bacterium]
MTERIEIAAMGECFGAHRLLWQAAALLSRRLTTATDDGHLMHLGASCMRIAAEGALQARSSAEALRSWKECLLAERQIRLATCWALMRGAVDNGTYDDVFALSRRAALLREQERQRLRRAIQTQMLV